MRLIDNYQANIVKRHHAILKPVVQGFHHGDEAHIIVLVLKFLHIAVDDHIVYRKTGKHPGSLAAQFNPVGKDYYFLAGVLNIPPGNFGKYHGFPPTCGKLVKEVHIIRCLLQVVEDGVQILNLVIVKCFFYVFRPQFQ